MTAPARITQGHTNNEAEAGRFTLEEAERHSHPNGPLNLRAFRGLPRLPAGKTLPAYPVEMETRGKNDLPGEAVL